MAEHTMTRPMPSRLRRWRAEHGITLREMADLVGLSESMMSRVETGERRLAAARKLRVARMLDVRVSDLFDPDEPLDEDSST